MKRPKLQNGEKSAQYPLRLLFMISSQRRHRDRHCQRSTVHFQSNSCQQRFDAQTSEECEESPCEEATAVRKGEEEGLVSEGRLQGRYRRCQQIRRRAYRYHEGHQECQVLESVSSDHFQCLEVQAYVLCLVFCISLSHVLGASLHAFWRLGLTHLRAPFQRYPKVIVYIAEKGNNGHNRARVCVFL